MECSLMVFGSREGVRRKRLMQVCPGQQGQADLVTDVGLGHPPHHTLDRPVPQVKRFYRRNKTITSV